MVLNVAAAAMTCFSVAHAETMPLSENLIGLTSPEGQTLLLGSEASNDYFPLSIHFTTQDNPAYCGPATIAMVLNALNVPRPASKMTLGLGMFDQENIFTPAATAVKPAASIVNPPYGMTLDELGGVFAAHDLVVDVVHASDSDLDTFRKTAVSQLRDNDKFILVNYLRKSIGQESAAISHHSAPMMKTATVSSSWTCHGTSTLRSGSRQQRCLMQ